MKKATTKKQTVAIVIDNSQVSDTTVNFIKGYNACVASISRAEGKASALLKTIGLDNLELQLKIVWSIGEYRDAQTKQTFKRSCARFVASEYPGYALPYKGNEPTLHALASDETTDVKGVVIKTTSDDDKAKAKAEAKAIADKKALKLIEAEQAVIALDTVKAEKDQAQSALATLTKKVNAHATTLKKEKEKSKSAVELLTAQVADLTKQLERAQHESAMTIKEYQKLIAMVKSATDLEALQKKVA